MSLSIKDRRFGPGLLQLVEAFGGDEIDRTDKMRQYVMGSPRNIPISATMGPAILLNYDQMIDSDGFRDGYQIGFVATDTVIYEQVSSCHHQHLIRVDIPTAAQHALRGRKLCEIVDGFEAMAGIWDEDMTISGIATFNGSTHLVTQVPTFPLDSYFGQLRKSSHG